MNRHSRLSSAIVRGVFAAVCAGGAVVVGCAAPTRAPDTATTTPTPTQSAGELNTAPMPAPAPSAMITPPPASLMIAELDDGERAIPAAPDAGVGRQPPGIDAGPGSSSPRPTNPPNAPTPTNPGNGSGSNGNPIPAPGSPPRPPSPTGPSPTGPTAPTPPPAAPGMPGH